MRITIRLVVAIFISWRGYYALSQSECDEEGSIRLFQTTNIRSRDGNVGRVELCVNGQWGTCTLDSDKHFWTDKNTQVACRQWGSSGGLNSIPPVNISIPDKSPANLSIHYSNVVCMGEERSLADCFKLPVSNGNPSREDHHKDVFVVCQPKRTDYSQLHTAGEQVGNIRLFGVEMTGEGAVEILTDKGWTGICPDSSWTGSDAGVICRALGYDFGRTVTYEVSESTTNRSVYDAHCSTEDDSSTDSSSSSRVSGGLCTFLEVLDPEDCDQPAGMFAGIFCSNSERSSQHSVRIVGTGVIDEDRAVGIVEVFLDSRWGVVCETDLEAHTAVNARVLCDGLGFDGDAATPTTLSSTSVQQHESHLKPLWVNRITCFSNRPHISDCVYEEPLGFSNCSHRNILTIDCGPIGTPREGNATLIIVGIGITVFIFIVVIFIFLVVFYKMFSKRRASATTLVGSYTMSTMMEGDQSPAEVRQPFEVAAVNDLFDEGDKDKGIEEKVNDFGLG